MSKLRPAAIVTLRRRPGLWLVAAGLLALLAVAGWQTPAQPVVPTPPTEEPLPEEPVRDAEAGPTAAEEEATTAHPSGTAVLLFENQGVSLPFTLAPAGPLFALQPIAGTLGLRLGIGPLGRSHTLHFEGKTVIVGPENPVMLITQPGGQEEVVYLSQTPVASEGALRVPLDFLEKAIGDEVGFDFAWNPGELRLRVTRRELRRLSAAVAVVHQHRVSTVEVQFSDRPRYQIARLEGALEVRLLKDRLELPVELPSDADPLVPRVTATPDRLRIELAPGAVAAEPRLLTAPVVRLIIEVFQQAPTTEAPEITTPPPPQGVTDDGRIRTIVIDPGHGGTETGAIGASGTAEKDLALLVARGLQLQLSRRLPVDVVLTRTEDVDLPLDTRTAIANQNQADLFISLHLNASFGASARGAETYFLSREASDQLAAQVAEAENRIAEEEDPELGLQLILWDLAQTHHLAESQRFARLVQEELNLALGLRDRGVKQAPFRVLMGATMPAVLVELGFLSNPDEETKLQSPGYRSELIDALVRAVIRFKTQLEAREGEAAAAEVAP